MRVVGLMSGTSLDGLDVCLCQLQNPNELSFQIEAFATYPMPLWLRQKIEKNLLPESSSVAEICALNFEVGEWFGGITLQFLESQGVPVDSVDLIGSHGQTLFHLPPGSAFYPSTLQIGEPSVIAQRTGITTVADFRPADMAQGGEGAPLVPFVDHLLFQQTGQQMAVQNIGGIANVTYWSPEGVWAFDTGPGNMLIDQAVSLLTEGKQTYDVQGEWAARGQVDQVLLEQWLVEDYFLMPPPKSTGRELFGQEDIQRRVAQCRDKGLNDEDLLATLTALTANSIAEAYRRFLPQLPQRVVVAGGGAHNATLLTQLGQALGCTVETMESLGISSDAREAFAFACLAYLAMYGQINHGPGMTGAREAVVLGKIIPGKNYLNLLKRVSHAL